VARITHRQLYLEETAPCTANVGQNLKKSRENENQTLLLHSSSLTEDRMFRKLMEYKK
jgi:hypothetical protein